ncbi:uncharacterized protein buc2l isoform X2 [Triplophysa rosa]|uniref:uncharacterized protein buc2l isoform X2 n=1 Tax=Triplophysa rosa TaxID=992332 RepID=UPI0025462C66|nr:uncharacterized protein buc2l isoform X2 [Triplophysa rosa]
MAAVSAQELSGGVSDVHSQAPRHTARLFHQDQQFHRQPFYIPNTQPVLPCQWPLSAPYVPYTGFPGLGYGMVMPSLVLPPCLDVSGYMLPHTPLHMLDHRRVMNPHLPPNISHQANRFHSQNGVPHNRVMVSTEVQTEPLCRSSAQDSHAGSESGRGTGCDSPVSASISFAENHSGACAEDTPVFTHNKVVSNNTINTTDVSALHKSEILVQAERVQIKCSQTPSTLKMIRTSENPELTCNDAGDLLQCSVGSILSEDVVLCSYRSLAIRKNKQGVDAGHLGYSRKHCLPVCKVRMSPSCAACPKLNASNVKSFEADKSCGMQRTCNLKKTKQNFKILRLPFDTQTYSQLEASVWSVESLVPYVPSILRPPKTPESHTVPVGRNRHTTESTKRHHREFRMCRSPYSPSTTFDTQTCRQLEASMWSVESLAPYVPSGDWMIGKGHVTPQKCPESDAIPLVKNRHRESTKRHGSPHRPSTNYSQLEASVWSVESLMPYVPSILKTPESHAVPVENNRHTFESTKRQELHKCGSPYRPSTSWLADLGNVYYYSKLPALQQKLSGFCKSPVEKPAPEGKQTCSPELSLLKQEKMRRKRRSSGRNECSGTAGKTRERWCQDRS